MTVTAAEFPHGVRCLDCGAVIEPGQPFETVAAPDGRARIVCPGCAP